MENIRKGLVPADKRLENLAHLLEEFPYQKNLFLFINGFYPGHPEIEALNKYFGFNGETL